ncbi:hypothetical protein DFO66_10243 [Brevibacterium sanguinis]|uniref:Uncharacterized protein n=2 Tax=Brevibacterium TaxID=1696 RepID=A0A366IMX4_9MICO|nr:MULTISPECIES: hypothetical protein [Brevibacterium]RBP66990.1 hypothetical protein DFO66_10243 [Brevibacterium sanguinis]RBP73515.1 hypothetical protein DFO65_10243 [Brevibacterium celere]
MSDHDDVAPEPGPDEIASQRKLEAELTGVIGDYMRELEPRPEDAVGLHERILKLVREDLYRGPSTQLQTGRGNRFGISTATVRGIVRGAVDAVDGIRARSVAIAAAGDPEGSGAEVRLTVAMRAGVDFPRAADEVRRSVAGALAEELGVPSTRIDIEVEDVYRD